MVKQPPGRFGRVPLLNPQPTISSILRGLPEKSRYSKKEDADLQNQCQTENEYTQQIDRILMEDDREGDIRVPLISFLFCLCLITGGIFLALYVFVPNLSQPWYPVTAFVLIGLPWVFWFLTYLYTCMKGCFGGGAVDSRQISRRQTTRNVSNSAMQNQGNQQNGGVNSSVASSGESEMPLTYSV